MYVSVLGRGKSGILNSLSFYFYLEIISNIETSYKNSIRNTCIPFPLLSLSLSPFFSLSLTLPLFLSFSTPSLSPRL